ncbi:MAG: YqaA family protein [Pseudomonadota bacterium]
MIRKLYDWVLAQGAKPYALWMLAFVSFIESSVFPIPPDVLLIPMILAAPHRAWWIATVCTVASVAGGLAGYGLGALAFETVGRPVLDFYGKMDAFGDFQRRFAEWGAWIVFGAGVTPFPYKVITIASGTVGLDLVVFTVSSIAARGLRFFLVAALLKYVGPPIQAWIEERLGLAFTVAFVLLIGGFVAAKYLV